MKNKLTTILSTLLIASTGFGMTGCATQEANQVSTTQSTELRSAKIATNYFMAEKNINYSETLYRVLWLDTKTSKMDFGGIWQPEDDLTLTVNNAIKKMGLQSEPITAIIDSELIAAYREGLKKDYLANLSSDASQTQGKWMVPKKEYIKKYPAFPEFDKISAALLEKGYKYLFEYLSGDIYGTAPGYGMVIVNMPSQLRLINLESKSVILSDLTITHELYQLGGDFKKLEENNLEKLKEAVTVGAGKMVSKDRLAPMLGLQQ